jgi:excisionase family DNA binding protein
MSDRVLIPLPGIGTLALDREAYDAALAAGASLPAVVTSPSGNDALLTAEQVAERLSLPQSWIEEATRQGRLPCHEFGRYRRYSMPEVIEAAKRERRDGASYEQ